MTNDNSYQKYRDTNIERIRQSARDVAARLRRVADDVERAGDMKDFTGIPSEVAHLVSWGVANAQADAPARWLRELIIFDTAIQDQNKKKLRAAVDTWEADGDDEKLVNEGIDPYLNGENL